MGIEKTVDDSRNLTIFTLQGKVTADELEEAIEGYWTEGPITPYVLWKGDGEGVSISHITGDELRKVSSVVLRFRDLTEQRRGGKTAIIAPADIDFGLSRIIEALHLNVTPELPYGFRVFRSEAEALAWIDEPSSSS